LKKSLIRKNNIGLKKDCCYKLIGDAFDVHCFPGRYLAYI